MAFTKQQPKIPAAVGNLRVYLVDRAARGDQPASQSIMGEVELLDASGQRVDVFNVNLEPHLAAQTVTQLKAFLTNLRTKAQEELI